MNKYMPAEMQIQNPFNNSRIAYSKPVFLKPTSHPLICKDPWKSISASDKPTTQP
jgi:hypothetical protein